MIHFFLSLRVEFIDPKLILVLDVKTQLLGILKYRSLDIFKLNNGYPKYTTKYIYLVI